MDIIETSLIIGESYRSDTLQEIFRLYLSDFLRNYPELFEGHGLDTRGFSRVYLRKEQLVKLLAVCLSDPAILTQWVSLLPPALKKLVAHLTWEPRVEVSESERFSGRPILVPGESKTATAPHLGREFCLFQLTPFKSYWHTRQPVFLLSLPTGIRSVFKQFFPHPPAFKLTVSSRLEKTAFVFRDRSAILGVLPVVLKYIKSGLISCNKNGTFSKSELKRLKSMGEIEEFYPDTQLNEWKFMRTDMIARLVLSSDYPSLQGGPLEMASQLAAEFRKPKASPALAFLTHLKGWYHTRARLNHQVHLTFCRLLGSFPVNQWIEIPNLLDHIRLNEIDLNPVTPEQADRYLYLTERWPGWGNRKHYIHYWWFDSAVMRPFVLANLFIAGAIGLLDLAVDQPAPVSFTPDDPVYPSIFDGLKAIRLTELGAYLLGIQRDYTDRFQFEQPVRFELDDKRLIFRLIRPDKSSVFLAERIAEKIGPNLFKVDHASFIANCANAVDLQRTVELFRHELPEALPEVWQFFFNSLASIQWVMKPIPDVTVFRIPPGKTDLMQALNKDTTLRNLVLRAEERHIIVYRDRIRAFRERLKKLGFLV